MVGRDYIHAWRVQVGLPGAYDGAHHAVLQLRQRAARDTHPGGHGLNLALHAPRRLSYVVRVNREWADGPSQMHVQPHRAVMSAHGVVTEVLQSRPGGRWRAT